MKFSPFSEKILGMEMWGCSTPTHQFIISNDDGKYAASYKARDQFAKPAIIIEDSMNKPFKDLQQAEAACRRMLKQLMN